MLVLEPRGKPEWQRKTSRSRVENQQQNQPTYNTESRNKTRGHTTHPHQKDSNRLLQHLKMTLKPLELCHITFPASYSAPTSQLPNHRCLVVFLTTTVNTEEKHLHYNTVLQQHEVYSISAFIPYNSSKDTFAVLFLVSCAVFLVHPDQTSVYVQLVRPLSLSHTLSLLWKERNHTSVRSA